VKHLRLGLMPAACHQYVQVWLMLVGQGLLKEAWHLLRAAVVAVRIAVGALRPVLESTRWRESWGAPCG
jgi:hypothetical protein